QSVGEQVLRERAQERVGMPKHGLAQAGGTVQLRSVEHGARGGDAEAAIVGAPKAYGIEVLQREADRVHQLVAAGAVGIFAMLLDAFAYGERLGHMRGAQVSILWKGRHHRRRWWWRRAEQDLHHVLAALHGRGSQRRRSQGKDAGVPEQAVAIRV